MERSESTYLLTRDAEKDLFDIAEYTLKNWGIDALIRYQKELTLAFESIANGTALNRQPFPQLPEVYITKSQKHFIFYIFQEKIPVIIAVIHEQRDVVTLLASRLIT